MNSIQEHHDRNFFVRTNQDEDGTVWFVAKDIAEALEYSDGCNLVRLFASVPEQWQGWKRILTVSRGETLCLTEQGLLFFLERSNKPKALSYQMWIVGEVIPSIRKTGSYSITPQINFSLKDRLDAARVVLEAAKIEGNQLALALDKVYASYTEHSVLKASDSYPKGNIQ